MSIPDIVYGASMGHVWDTFYRRNSSKFVDMVNESSIQPLKNGAPGRSSSILKMLRHARNVTGIKGKLIDFASFYFTQLSYGAYMGHFQIVFC